MPERQQPGWRHGLTVNDSSTRLPDCESTAPLLGARKGIDHDIVRGRFADRTKRLSRRQESDVFRVYLVPVTWLLALAGLLGLGGLWMAEGTESMTASFGFPLFLALFLAPLATHLLRFVRGHFHPAVREL